MVFPSAVGGFADRLYVLVCSPVPFGIFPSEAFLPGDYYPKTT
jgi:hypothetical protein